MNIIATYAESLLRLFYPQLCLACGNEVFQIHQHLCWRCQEDLPFTGYELMPENPVRRIFDGRLHIEGGCAMLYFAKDSITQAVVHQMKYKGEQDFGIWLGEQMGQRLAASPIYASVDAIVPLPLNGRKLRQRGYNQAELLAKGIAKTMQKPVETVAIMRTTYTSSQTRKSRLQRWLNVEHVFDLQKSESLHGKHVLLVDDVITTGATMEACGAVLLKVPGLKLSVCSLAHATR